MLKLSNLGAATPRTPFISPATIPPLHGLGEGNGRRHTGETSFDLTLCGRPTPRPNLPDTFQRWSNVDCIRKWRCKISSLSARFQFYRRWYKYHYSICAGDNALSGIRHVHNIFSQAARSDGCKRRNSPRNGRSNGSTLGAAAKAIGELNVRGSRQIISCSLRLRAKPCAVRGRVQSHGMDAAHSASFLCSHTYVSWNSTYAR